MNQRLPLVCHTHLKADTSYTDVLNQMGIVIVEPAYDELFMKVTLPQDWSVRRSGSYWSYLLDEKGRERANFFAKRAFWDQEAFLHFSKRFSLSGEVADYDETLFQPKPEMIEDGYEIVLVDVSPEQYSFNSDHTIELKGLDYRETIFSNGRIKRQVKQPKLVPNPDYVALTGYEKYAQPFHIDVLDHDKSVVFSSQTVQTDFAYSPKKHWEFYHHRDTLVEQVRQECLGWLDQHYPDWLNPLSYWD